MKKHIILLMGLLLVAPLKAHNTDLLIAGTLDFCDGLGKIVYGLIDHLGDRLKINYNADHVCTFYYDPYKLRKRVNKVFDCKNADIFLYTNPIVTLLSNDCYKQVPQSTIKIAYSMIESDRIPSECVDCFNKEFDAIVIPDNFLFEVYRNSGITIPIFCIPTGLYLEKMLNYSSLKPSSGPFVFGCASVDIYRKNLRKLVDAFVQKYGNNKEYQLKLHVKYAFNNGQETLEDYIDRQNVNNIEICSDTLSEDEYIDFLRSLDCYVLPSRGEGFSNTPREAMALGIPCILSNNTAHTTICDSGYVVPIECPNTIDFWNEGLAKTIGQQKDCEVEYIARAMEKITQNYDSYFELAQQGREWVKQYLWPALQDDYLTLFDPKNVELSESDSIQKESQTIYTKDKNLHAKFKKLIEGKRYEVTTGAGVPGFCDGIGRIEYGILDVLNKDIDIASYQPAKWANEYAGYNELDDPYNVEKRTHKTNSLEQSPVFLYIDTIHGYMNDGCFAKVPSDVVRFAYSMFESSAIPDKAVENLNQHFDAVVVPDIYHVDVYKNSGVTLPIFVVPTGLYLEKFLAEDIKIKPLKPFTFGCIATCKKRKNIKKLLNSFAKLYKNNPEYCLKIHTKKPNFKEATLDVLEQTIGSLFERVEGSGSTSLADFFKNLPDPEETLEEMIERLKITNVIVTTDIMTERQYIDYFKSIDCYLSISTGEGFSNTPREAMALGVPAIVSNNTGQTTICNSKKVIAVDSPLVIDAFYEGLPRSFGKQYDCTQEAVVKAMQDVVTNYNQYLEQATGARQWVKQYLWPNLKQQYLTLLKPTKVVLGSENKVDGITNTITTTDENFYQKLAKL